MTSQEIELGQLCVQVQLNLAPELDAAALREAAERLARSTPSVRGIGFAEGEDNGKYLNVTFATDDPSVAWQHIQQTLLESSALALSLKKSAIVLCTGQDGWNDCLVLYHFDPKVAVDIARNA